MVETGHRLYSVNGALLLVASRFEKLKSCKQSAANHTSNYSATTMADCSWASYEKYSPQNGALLDVVATTSY